MKKQEKKESAITLIALVITIIILLILAGVSIATLTGENGLLVRAKQAKQEQIKAEMKESLNLAIQDLQVEKLTRATLEDITQEWANTTILNDYNVKVTEESLLNGKLIVMNKNNINGKFLLDENLNIATVDYNIGNVELEYTIGARVDNKVKINIILTDKINGIKQIDYPEGNPLKVVDGVKEQISIDYEVELGKEYKFVITSGDESKTEKIIRINDYFYNVTKIIGEGAIIDNNATKTAYNKPYEATITIKENYEIDNLIVMMGEQNITTSGNNIVDKDTGRIYIEKVTDNIEIRVVVHGNGKELKPIDYVCSSMWNGYPASKAFDGKEERPYYWHAAENSSAPQYCGAKFDKKVYIKKFYLNFYYQSKNIILQGSNDGINWVDIQSYSCSNRADMYYVTNTYSENYKYYCIKALDESMYVAYFEIKFYGN